MATLITETQSNVPDAVVDLFEIDFTTRISTAGSGASNIYFTGEQGDITWDSQVYTATSMNFTAPTIQMDGKVPQVSYTMFGQFPAIVTEIDNYLDQLEGATFIHTSTYKKFLDGGSEPDTTQAEIFTYTIDSIRQRSKVKIEFLLTIGVGIDRLNDPGLRTISVI